MKIGNTIPYAMQNIDDIDSIVSTKKLIDLEILGYFRQRLLYDIKKNTELYIAPASVDKLGIVKIGENIDVTEDGTISVPKFSWDNIEDKPDLSTKQHDHLSSEITDATNESVPNMVVKRDSEGNIKCNNFIGDLKGNSDTATKLKNPIKINGVELDGSTDITITASPVIHTLNSHTGNPNKMIYSNADGIVTDIDMKTVGCVLTSTGVNTKPEFKELPRSTDQELLAIFSYL